MLVKNKLISTVSLKLSRNLKAASLTESVIAIVIISICLSIAFMIYMKVVSISTPVYYIDAKQKIEKITNTTMQQRDYEANTYDFVAYKIEKQVIIDKKFNIVTLHYTIVSSSKKHVVQKIIPYEIN